MAKFQFGNAGTKNTFVIDSDTHVTITAENFNTATVKIKPYIDGAYREFAAYNFTALTNTFLRLGKMGRTQVQIEVVGNPTALVVGLDPAEHDTVEVVVAE